jgi:hypothetical protein
MKFECKLDAFGNVFHSAISIEGMEGEPAVLILAMNDVLAGLAVDPSETTLVRGSVFHGLFQLLNHVRVFEASGGNHLGNPHGRLSWRWTLARKENGCHPWLIVRLLPNKLVNL